MGEINAWWWTRSGRERVALTLMALAVCAFVAVWVADGLLARAADRARVETEAEQVRLARMRIWAAELGATARRAPLAPIAAGEIPAAVERALRGAVAGPERAVVERIDEGRIRVRGARVVFDSAMSAFEDLHRAFGLRIVELSAAALDTEGWVRLEAVLGR